LAQAAMAAIGGTVAVIGRMAPSWSITTGNFVGGAKEGPAEVMGVVEDGDLLLVVCREEKAKGLDELRHFFAEARLEIHRAGETGDVAVASHVHRGDRGEECFPGGVELHFLRY
jgi:hypothetical protein